jgi:FKBP-type peptidyl-prolyl cis-trans isomerase
MSKEIIEQVKLTQDEGVIKRIIRRGEGGDLPKGGDVIKVNFLGQLENGDVFDASVNYGQPMSFTIGAKQVLDGWERGVCSMEIGECAEIVITSKYGYGLEGCPPKIPAGATLIFTCDIVKIGSREPTRKDMSDDEVYKYALK